MKKTTYAVFVGVSQFVQGLIYSEQLNNNNDNNYLTILLAFHIVTKDIVTSK